MALTLGFLASHRGSNMQAVIDACKSGTIPAVPAVVISNNREAFCLERARHEDIPAVHLSATTHPDPEALDAAILAILRGYGVELVVLAGYMKKLGPKVLAYYRNRILNIHPSLLPKYGGQGMYGMHVHAAVIAAGDTESGATVHLVNEEYDRGLILGQRRVAVLPGDTVEILAQRVLAVEHPLLVEIVGRIAGGELGLPGNVSE